MWHTNIKESIQHTFTLRELRTSSKNIRKRRQVSANNIWRRTKIICVLWTIDSPFQAQCLINSLTALPNDRRYYVLYIQIFSVSRNIITSTDIPYHYKDMMSLILKLALRYLFDFMITMSNYPHNRYNTSIWTQIWSCVMHVSCPVSTPLLFAPECWSLITLIER